MDNYQIAVLGAGLTGLELGRRLKESARSFIIFEKESRIGGLCRTNKTGDYYWDFAVHAMYSRSREIMEYFYSLPLDYRYLQRNVKIFHSASNGKKYLLDYPFETGIKDLPLRHKIECIQGYLAVWQKSKRQYSNLKDWIDDCVGAGIAKHFMFPYNNKIWNCSLSDLSEKLISSRVDPASISDIVLSAFGRKIVGRAYQAKFIYPKRGIQQFIDYTAKDIKDNIILNANVKRLVKHCNRWIIITEDGAENEAGAIISTIPLVDLLKKIDIEGIKKEYDVFKWNNTFFIMIGLKQGHNFELIKDCHWAFFKEDEIFYRVTLMHNFSPDFLPVLVAEVTQKGDILNKTEAEIKDLVINDIIRKGIIGSINEIAETDVKLLKHTYPIPTVGLEDIKESVRSILQKHNIFLLGRNGNWDYINMDEAVLNVQEFVELLKNKLN